MTKQQYENRAEAERYKAKRILHHTGEPKTEQNIAEVLAAFRQHNIPATYRASLTMAKARRGEIPWESLSMR